MAALQMPPWRAKHARNTSNKMGEPDDASELVGFAAARGDKGAPPNEKNGTAFAACDDDASTVASSPRRHSPVQGPACARDHAASASGKGKSEGVGAGAVPDAHAFFEAWQQVRMENWARSQRVAAQAQVRMENWYVNHRAQADAAVDGKTVDSDRNHLPASMLWLNMSADEEPDPVPNDSSVVQQADAPKSPDEGPSGTPPAQPTPPKRASKEKQFDEEDGRNHQEHLAAGGEPEPPSGSSASGTPGQGEESATEPSAAGDEEDLQTTDAGGGWSFAPLRRQAKMPEGEFYFLPSLGSSGHFSGTCRPCAHIWRPDGCSKGLACTYCHFCGLQEWKLYKHLYRRYKDGQKEVASKKQRGGAAKAKLPKAQNPGLIWPCPPE